ncbi:MAG: protein kinase [Deltaproteobacteria bacterium]|nr:protein kinase [Deltaproteobacteria bacterium]
MSRRDDDRLDGPSAAAWSAIAELADDGAERGAEPEAGRSPFDLPEPERYQRGLELGAGGMGRVTQAFDRRLGREVALKEVIAQSPAHEARLAREAAITARLDHPGVVVVHDAGRTPEGTLFYTMRVVRGRTLDRALAEAADLDARLRLLRHVLHACEAVAFAHRHGVVHRDLKPDNIMVGEFGETQVLDWGLARDVGEAERAPIDAPAATSPVLTRHGTVVGTPRYMSPEQAAGAAPSTRADVWSLGAILFEVCAGRPLRDVKHLDDAALRDLARATPMPDVRALEPRVPRDLASLVARALAPPDQRHPDAKALADALAAWLDGRRIAGHDYTAWELFARILRAWRVPIAIGLLALVATGVVLALAYARVDAERERAVEARERADHALARLLSARATASANDDARPEAEVLAAHALALEPTPEARGAVMALGRAGRPRLVARLPLPARCRDADVTSDLGALVCGDDDQVAVYDLDPALAHPIGPPRWRARVDGSWGVTTLGDVVVSARDTPPLRFFRLVDGGPVTAPSPACCTYPPRGNLAGNAVALAGTAQLSVVTARAVHEPSPCVAREEIAGAIDDAGRRWAVSCGDGALFVGALGEPGRRLTTPLRAPRGPASAIAFAGDDRIVLGSSDGALVVHDLATDAVVHDVASGVMMTRAITTSPDGRWAVVAGDRGAPRLLDVDSGTWRGRLPGVGTHRLRFVRASDPGPPTLVALGDALGVWRLEPGDTTGFEVGGGVTGLALAPDAKTLAVTRGRGVELRDVATGRRVAARELDAIVKPGAFSPDGATFGATPGSARALQRWQVEGLTAHARALGAPYALHRVAALVDADGGTLWIGAPHGPGVLLWRDGDDAPLHVDPERRSQIVEVAVAADRRRLVMLTSDDEIVWLDASAPHAMRALTHPGARTLAVDAPAELALVGEPDGASLVRLEDGALVRVYAAVGRALTAVALAPDLRFAAGGDAEGRVVVWDAEGRVHAALAPHTRRVSALRFAPDARWLATGSWDMTVRMVALDAAMPTPDAAEAAWGITRDTIIE